MLNIRFAKTTDTDLIMKFIHNHWKENHILSRDKNLFLYEYQNEDMINFVIAIDEGNNIYGILGFIKSSNDYSDIWAAMWKAIKHEDHPMLGVELLEYLRTADEYNRLTCLGVNHGVVGIYRYFGMYTNTLNQYVLINTDRRNFNILKVEDDLCVRPIDFIINSEYSLAQIGEEELDFDFNNKKNIPYKDKQYFIKRYFNHPVYKYNVYGVYKRNRLTSLIVTREIIVKDSKILRIMDYLGDENDIVYVSRYLYQIVVENDYEYVDFMEYGFNDINLVKAGFIKINFDSTEIVAPNYFSPFIQENIKINFVADTQEIAKLRMCKADGDQDRPQ